MKALIRTIAGVLMSAMVTAVYAVLGRFQHGEPKRYARRTFVRNTVLGSVGLSLAALGGGFLAFFWPLKISAFGTEVVVPSGAIPPVGDPPFRDQAGNFYVINNPDGALALYWKCTHLGCTIPWNDAADNFQCPCHGSVFDRTGVLIAGPAPRPMDLMAVTVDDAGNLIVNTGEIIERTGYDPAQATPV
jgi:cytochrome b6-f complex iron-sulfur subunit